MNKLLRNFNMRRAEELIKSPEFAYLTLEYLNRPTSLSEIVKNEKNARLVDAYTRRFELLKGM